MGGVKPDVTFVTFFFFEGVPYLHKINLQKLILQCIHSLLTLLLDQCLLEQYSRKVYQSVNQFNSLA